MRRQLRLFLPLPIEAAQFPRGVNVGIEVMIGQMMLFQKCEWKITELERLMRLSVMIENDQIMVDHQTRKIYAGICLQGRVQLDYSCWQLLQKRQVLSPLRRQMMPSGEFQQIGFPKLIDKHYPRFELLPFVSIRMESVPHEPIDPFNFS